MKNLGIKCHVGKLVFKWFRNTFIHRWAEKTWVGKTLRMMNGGEGSLSVHGYILSTLLLV